MRSPSQAAFSYRLHHRVLVAIGLGGRISKYVPHKAQDVGDDIIRLVPQGVSGDALRGSLALAQPRPALATKHIGDVMSTQFARLMSGHQEAKVHVDAGTDLYGTGECAGPLHRNDKVTVCWNTDAPGYTDTSPSLYQSHPWVLGVRDDGSAFGVLADTTWRCEIDLRDGIAFRADGPPFAVYVLEGATPQDVVKQLAALTGYMSMPPRWALGYHQCRFSYTPAQRVLEVAQEFRERKIPCDVIWMDIDYMDEYRIFTFDPKGFSDPKNLSDGLHELGFHGVWMIDPAPKASAGYDIYDDALDGGHVIMSPSGAPAFGNVWPGKCVFPDFTQVKTQRWWARQYQQMVDVGVDGVWNDMNEPAVFDRKSKTLSPFAKHQGDNDLPPGPHAKYHNVYGMLMARATRKGMLAAAPQVRPFVLTRASYIGGHRDAATWTGDNRATEDDLKWSISMALNLGLSGQPFVGPDIGGFLEEGSADLFARWMGVGTLLPFARGHTDTKNIDKEPWAFAADTEATCKAALERRYRLLPYLYTLFREAATSGLPIVRPLFFADPSDRALRREDRAFLLGADIMVTPDVENIEFDPPPRPKGIWRPLLVIDEDSSAALPMLDIRGGAIVPIGPVMQHTGERELDELMLIVSLDEVGAGTGMLYEDDGDGFAYREGRYRLTRFDAKRVRGTVKVNATAVDGHFTPRWDRVRVIVLDEEGEAVGDTTGPLPMQVDVGG